MTSLVFVIGVFISVQLVSYSCEGKIIEPPGGNSLIVEPGFNVTIAWSFDDDIKDVILRSWSFIRGKKAARLGSIFDDNEQPNITSTIFPFAISKPATLILTNVDFRYNGTYQFTLITGWAFLSQVMVDIAVKPTAKVCKSSPITVDEGENITCWCTGRNGNPPANVTWYDNGNEQIDDTRDEENILTLINVHKKASGTYKCVAQSYTLKDEESIEVKVRPSFAPVVTSLTSSPDEAVLGESVTITCEACARPSPSYTIIHNHTITVSRENIYIIKIANYSDAGSYKCIAKNKLGNNSKSYPLSFAGSFGITTIATTRTMNVPSVKNTATEKAVCCKSNDECMEWHRIVASLLSGIIIGILFSYIFVGSRRRFRNRSLRSEAEPEKSKGSSIYQDLDLSKINSEENYQSLRVDSGRNEAVYENQNDSTYTELNKVREVENSYQSLT